MSITVTRGKNKMILRDKNQLAAFLNNGWTEVKETAKKTEKTVETAEAPKTTRRRKAATAD